MPTSRKDKITWLPGHYYHIYNRGARRKSIFLNPENYILCLRKMKRYCLEFNLTLIAYCLMPNHYHFLVRQNDQYDAGLLAQRVFLSYSQAFNKSNQMSGTLFEGRYKAKHVDNEPWLLYLCKYIHFNPVKDGIVLAPEAWPYSNYLDWIGKREGTLLDQQFVIDHFDGSQTYREEMKQFLIASNYDTFD